MDLPHQREREGGRGEGREGGRDVGEARERIRNRKEVVNHACFFFYSDEMRKLDAPPLLFLLALFL